MTGTTTPDTDALGAGNRKLADRQATSLEAAAAAGAVAPEPGSRPAQRAAGAGKPDTARNRRAAAGLTPEIQNRIGSQLQSLYNDLLAESTPDRFLKLLEDLDRKS